MILNLKPEIVKQLHPLATQWFDELSAAIEQQLTIDGLTVADIEDFLSNDEKVKFQRHKTAIEMALLTCVNPNAVHPHPLLHTGLGPVFLMMQLRSFIHVENIKSLLRQVYERKAAAKPEAMRKRDELERRTRAFEALNPPIALARKYLASPLEYLRFEISISGAVDAYLEAGELYRSHEKAKEYRQCIEMIEDRQREEARKQRAQSAADTYNRRLNKEIRALTNQLHLRERNLSTYFRATAQDKRYSGHSFEYALPEEKKRELDVSLAGVASKQLERLLSEDLRQFVVLPLKYYRRYYPLPSATYSFEEVPCLDFSFDIFAAICAEVWLKPGTKIFDGLEFPLPFTEGQNGLSLLKSPEFLGYYYSIAGPKELDVRVFWKRVPLIILTGLLNGEMRPKGTIVSAASDEGVTYRIPRVEGEITIPNAFADYLRMIGTIDQMINMNILTARVADIVKSALIELAQTCELSSSKGTAKRKNSKKTMMDQLFDRDKRPGDPEVKALGLKPNTRYRYYQEWKKTRNHPGISSHNEDKS